MENPTGKKLKLPKLQIDYPILRISVLTLIHPREAQSKLLASFPSDLGTLSANPRAAARMATGRLCLTLPCRARGRLTRVIDCPCFSEMDSSGAGNFASGHTARESRQTGVRVARTNFPQPAAGLAGGSCWSPCIRPSLRLPGPPLPPEANPGSAPRSSAPGPSCPRPSLHSLRITQVSTRRPTGHEWTTLTGSVVGARRQNSSAALWSHAKKCSGGKRAVAARRGS